MTTDPTSADDRVARLAALRQRRDATGPAAAAVEASAATASPRQRSPRRHTGAGGRILAGSLSAAAALGLMGAMARAAGPSTDAPTPTTAPTGAAPTVIVIRRPAGPTDVAVPATPQVSPTAATPVTATRGS